MEYVAEQALLCKCGLPRDVSMAKGADADFEVEALQCHACLAKHTKAKGWKGDNIDAVYFAVRHTGG